MENNQTGFFLEACFAETEGFCAHLHTFLYQTKALFKIIFSSLVESFWVAFHYEYTPNIFAIVVLLVLFAILYRKYLISQRNWLSYLAQIKIRELRNRAPSDKLNIKFHTTNSWKAVKIKAFSPRFFGYPFAVLFKLHRYFTLVVRNDFRNLYLPSLTSLAFIVSIVLFLVYLSHRNTIVFNDLFSSDSILLLLQMKLSSNEHSNVAAILTGEVAIVFALIIFVAESIRGSKNKDEKRVLLKISSLWFLSAGATLSLIAFLWFPSNSLSVLFPILLGLIIISSFWKVITHLIDPTKQEKNRTVFLKDRIRKSFESSIERRVANNILFEKVGKDKDIQINIAPSFVWVRDKTVDYLPINLQRSGWLSDINFSELSKLAISINTEIKELSANNGPEVEAEIKSEFQQFESNRDSKIYEYPPAYMIKTIGETFEDSVFLSSGNTVLLVPPVLREVPNFIETVRARLTNTFTVDTSVPASTELQNEMQNLQEQTLAAIQSSELVKLKKLTDTYLSISETILEILVQYGGGYTANRAHAERHGLYGNWNEISWLRNDISGLLSAASKSESRDIAITVFSLPRSIAIRALQVKDQLLFQEFISFASFLYYHGINASPEIKKLALDHSWRHVKEIVGYYIRPKLEDAARAKKFDDLESYKDFALQSYIVFQSLLKSMIDNEDTETFENALKAFCNLFKHLDWDDDVHTISYLERQIGNAFNHTEEEKLQSQLDHIKPRSGVGQALSGAKNKVNMALAALCLNRIVKSQHEKIGPINEPLKTFYDLLIDELPSDLIEFLQLYEKVLTYSERDFWGWDRWESIPDGEARFLDVYGKFDALFCVRMLNLLSGDKNYDFGEIEIIPTRDFASAIDEEGSGRLLKKLSEILENATEWACVLDDNAIRNGDVFKALLIKLKQNYETYEANYLKEVEINKEMLQEFSHNVRMNFEKAGKLRGILKEFGAYRDITNEVPGEDIQSYGYNQINDKAAFIKDWHVDYRNIGASFGRGLAKSEDALIFATITEKLKTGKEVHNGQIIQEIQNIIVEQKYKKPIVILNLFGAFKLSLIQDAEAFIPKWSDNCIKSEISELPGFMGLLKVNDYQVPIFTLRLKDNRLPNKVVIADGNQLGELIQYSPAEKQEEVVYCDGELLIKVTDLNKDYRLRNTILENKPVWPDNENDPEGYLRQKVVVNIYEKFDYKLADNNPGVCFDLISPEDQE